MICNAYDSAIILLYNGRDGVMTDSNGLLYMRARYYSPDLKRFVNADIIAGVITDPVTLNRYSYANGNPVSNIDPFGLSAERGNIMYGYMGKAYGLSDTLLYYATGFAQISAGTSNSLWILTGTGDDPIDQSNIKRGIELYNRLH